MGSIVELNDTLRITEEQGFPKELVYEKHKDKPLKSPEGCRGWQRGFIHPL